MAEVEVVDNVLWTRRVHGAPELRSALDALPPETTVRLKVAGRVGLWRKMSRNRTTGAPTPGLQPLGEAAQQWQALFRAHKASGGTVVQVELAPVEAAPAASPGRPTFPPDDPRSRWHWPDPVEQAAAWEAFKSFRNAGWRSEKPYGPRDELYERDD